MHLLVELHIIKMHGTGVKITKEAVTTKFLGLQFDHNLNWKEKKHTE